MTDERKKRGCLRGCAVMVAYGVVVVMAVGAVGWWRIVDDAEVVGEAFDVVEVVGGDEDGAGFVLDGFEFERIA